MSSNLEFTLPLVGNLFSIIYEYSKTLSKRTDLTPEQKTIIEKLLSEALSKGLISNHKIDFQTQKLKGGVATELVTINNAKINFAIKIDNNIKLVKEALILKSISFRPELPKDFAVHFPEIYALKNDKPPYAYIMQFFEEKSFAEHIFKLSTNAIKLNNAMSAVLNILIPAYKSSKNDILTPNVQKLYIDRIYERLTAARSVNADFKIFSSKPVKINGIKYKTPENYLTIIKKNIDKFSVDFSTFVHGDCHLGNILIGFDNDPKSTTADVKFIDIRDWYESDYIFDIAKIVQYLKVTGPAEMVPKQPKVIRDVKKGIIEYSLETNANKTEDLLSLIKEKVLEFSKEVKDKNWFRRYRLAVASTLLGLHINRIKTTDNKKLDVSYIMYAEGLKYLSLAATLKNK